MRETALQVQTLPGWIRWLEFESLEKAASSTCRP